MTGLSALALAAAAAAVTALALAGHQQAAAIALEAAEAGIAHALIAASERAGPAVAGPMPHDVGGITQARFETRTTLQEGNGALPPGFSIGAASTAFQSQHYLVVSDGQAVRNVRVRLEQGFYVVVPQP
jgi:hypothetical protein